MRRQLIPKYSGLHNGLMHSATTTINGEVLDPSESVPAKNNEVYAIVCTPFEYPNDFDITASIRGSSGSLVQNPILSEEFTYTPGQSDTFSTMVVMESSAADISC